MAELECGGGRVVIFGVRRGDRIGICLSGTEAAHAIDSSAGYVDGEEYETKDGDVIIWFDNLVAARVMQDAVNVACLRLNDWTIHDTKVATSLDGAANG